MRSPRVPARKDKVCGCPSWTVTRGAGACRGKSGSLMSNPFVLGPRVMELRFRRAFGAVCLFCFGYPRQTPVGAPRLMLHHSVGFEGILAAIRLGDCEFPQLRPAFHLDVDDVRCRREVPWQLLGSLPEVVRLHVGCARLIVAISQLGSCGVVWPASTVLNQAFG